MRNIHDVFDEFLPDGEQLERMAQRIAEGAPGRRVLPIRRTAAILAAAVLLGVMSVSAAAYVNPSLGEAVRRIFTREEELIDAHAVEIDAVDRRESASLCVEKAVRDGDTTYLYCTVISADGRLEGDFFLAEHIRLMQTVEELDSRGNPVQRTYPVINRPMGETGILAGDILEELPPGPAEAIRWILPLTLGEDTAGEYSLTLTEPFTAVSLPDGTFARTVIADELSVEFTLSDITEELDVYEVFPLTEFPLGGGTVRLKSVRITPLEVRVTFDDPEGEMVPVPGHPELEVPVMEFLSGFTSLYVWEDPDWTTSPLGDRQEYFVLTRGHSWGVRLYIRDGSDIIRVRGAGSSLWTFPLDDPIYPEDVYKITLAGPNDEEIVLWAGNGLGYFLDKSENSTAAEPLAKRE